MAKKGNGFGKFLAGAAIGVGLGVLFAPKAGSETRKELKEKMDELVKKIKEINVEEVKDSFMKKIEELKEELAIEVEVGEIMTTINYNYPDFQLVMYCYKTKIIGGEIKLLEHKDYCFVDANHIMLLDWLPADLGFVKELKEYLTNI